MAIIEPLMHRCVVQSGDMAGNKIEQPVSALHIEYPDMYACDNCGGPLATIDQVVAHIYAQLTQLS